MIIETKKMFHEVWNWNKNEEMRLIEDCLRRNYRFIAIDTEFPGCLRESSKDATNEDRYDDMSFNVDKTKLIQLGFTLFDSNGRIGGTWEINFSDFSEIEDARNEKSIEFLKRNGLDLEKIREDGIGIEDFFSDFSRILTKSITWVTFHGLYDVAYLLKYFTGETLPVTSKLFSEEVARVFGSVYDLKAMAGRYEGLSSRLGLQSLAQEVGLNRVGAAHHAGSDSELTARVFISMVRIFHNVKESEGFVYGLGYRVISVGLKHEVMMMQHHRVAMMRRCYGPPPLPPPFMSPMPQLRPKFVAGFPPLVPRVPMS